MLTKSTKTFRLDGRPRKTLLDLSSALQGFEVDTQKAKPINSYSLGSFREVSRIGDGSSYVVEKALSVGKNVVAVKRTQFAVNGVREPPSDAGQFSFEDQIDILYTEVRCLTHPPLRKHPNIVDFMGYGWHTSYGISLPFIVLEYAQYGTLDSFLQSDPMKPWSLKLKLVRDVASGLSTLHSCKLIHGDMKMQNVLVFGEDQRDGFIAKLSDFGHTIFWDSTRAFEPLYGGTPLFNAPEVHDQDFELIPIESMPACDTYSFGLLVWGVVKDGKTFFETSWLEDPQDDKIDFLQSCDGDFLVDKAIQDIETARLPGSDVLVQVLQGTLAFEPNDRKSMSEITKLLDDMAPTSVYP